MGGTKLFLLCWLWTCAAKKCRIADVQREEGFGVPAQCTILALGGEKLGDAGVVALGAALAATQRDGGLANLVEIHLPTTGMGIEGVRAVASFLSAAGSGSSLRVMNLYGNAIGDEGAVLLARLFAGNNAQGIPLELLGLGVNDIGSEGARALATVLGACDRCPLKTLGLYRNRVGDAGAAALATALVGPNVSPLSALFLGGNGVGPAGAADLAKALGTNTQLKVLGLEGGGLGDAGLLSLAAALATSKTLTALDVRSCLPTHQSCKAGALALDDPSLATAGTSGGQQPGSGAVTAVGLRALREAVEVRARDREGSHLKVIGDIDFSAGAKKRK